LIVAAITSDTLLKLITRKVIDELSKHGAADIHASLLPNLKHRLPGPFWSPFEFKSKKPKTAPNPILSTALRRFKNSSSGHYWLQVLDERLHGQKYRKN
jgi:hypothetical protein